MVAAEILASVAIITGAVALLDQVAPVTGLGVLYLLAVLLIAVRRGQVAALATAVVSVLALNFFFIDPRYRLTIADSQNVVALLVFLVVALVVGRLAATARAQTGEAERRALLASAREREAMILAQAASSLLAGENVAAQLERMGDGSGTTVPRAVRAGLTAAPDAESGEIAVRLPTQSRSGWLYVRRDIGWEREDAERLATALARLIDVAGERERLAAQSAEAEAARRADVAKTAVLHAVSHDFRSPLTAITTAASGLREGGLSARDRDDLVNVVETESQRLARMVTDLLDLSKIQAGAVDPRADWVDLRDVVAGAAAQVRAADGDHPVSIELTGRPAAGAGGRVAARARVREPDRERRALLSPGRTGADQRRRRRRARDGPRDRPRPGHPAARRARGVRAFLPRARVACGLRPRACDLARLRGGEHGRLRLGSRSDGTSFAVSFPAARQPSPSA